MAGSGGWLTATLQRGAVMERAGIVMLMGSVKEIYQSTGAMLMQKTNEFGNRQIWAWHAGITS